MKAIQTEQLTKYYGKARGIVDVSLSVEAGDFFGFIGPNGAGKSTTIRTLLGLLTPTSGKAEVLGMDITAHRTEVLENVGYLPSETVFYRGMRVEEILSLSAKLRRADCSAEAKRLCERLELDPTRRVEQLSFGNRKKVGIVAALQHKPSLYILDEPTSGLDPLMQREFYSILKERNEEGATVFLSSHVLSEVGRYCKHAAIIREGSLLVTDSVDRMAHTGIKRVTLRGVDEIPTIENARDVKLDEGALTFLYSGTPESLIATLAGIRFEDFTVSDPDLEEIFLHYYGRGNEA